MNGNDLGSSRLNRQSPLPLYYQLREFLIGGFGTTWKEGDMLPSEGELCQRFEVSRTVVRQALDELEHEGLVYKLRGKGTFVASPKLETSHVQTISGFHAWMTAAGHRVTNLVLRQEVGPADSYVAGLLEIDVGAPVIRVDRVRSVDDVPMSIVRSSISFDLCPGLEKVDLRDVGMLAVIKERWGLEPVGAHRTIGALQISARDAKHLGVRPRSAALQLESLSRTANHVPLEHFITVYRGDRSKLEIELVGRGDAAGIEKESAYQTTA